MAESAAILPRPALRGPETASAQPGWGAGLALSLAVHLGLVAWLAWMPDGTPGPARAEPQATMVEIVTLPVPPEPAPEPEPAPRPAAAAAAEPPAAIAETKPPPRPAAKARPVRAAETIPAQVEAVAAAPVAPAEAAPAQEPASAPPPSPPSPARAGGDARADDEFRRYAEQVWAEIAARRPPRVRKRGLAMLEFTLSRRGILETARIAISSGDGALDRFALEALAEAAPFPPPPATAAEAQLTFRLPFEFR